MMMDDEKAIKDFKKLVNMTPKKLEAWLETEDSKKVGFKDGGEGESVGHKSGKKIIACALRAMANYAKPTHASAT